jgi:ribosomal protein L35
LLQRGFHILDRWSTSNWRFNVCDSRAVPFENRRHAIAEVTGVDDEGFITPFDYIRHSGIHRQRARSRQHEGLTIVREKDFAHLLQRLSKHLDEIRRNPFMDQWQAQTLANIALRAQVALHSKISRAEVEACRMVHVDDLQSAVEASLARLNGNARAAVLPEGPLTIPYVK